MAGSTIAGESEAPATPVRAGPDSASVTPNLAPTPDTNASASTLSSLPAPASPAKVLIPAQDPQVHAVVPPMVPAALVQAVVPPMPVSATPAQACVHCEAPSATIKPCSSCLTRRMVCSNCTTRQFEYDGVLWLCHEHAPPPLPAPAPAAPAPPPLPLTPPAMALTPAPLWLTCPPVPTAANAELDAYLRDLVVIPDPVPLALRARGKRPLPPSMVGGCSKR
jgi:hypothetical protein